MSPQICVTILLQCVVYIMSERILRFSQTTIQECGLDKPISTSFLLCKDNNLLKVNDEEESVSLYIGHYVKLYQPTSSGLERITSYSLSPRYVKDSLRRWRPALIAPVAQSVFGDRMGGPIHPRRIVNEVTFCVNEELPWSMCPNDQVLREGDHARKFPRNHSHVLTQTRRHYTLRSLQVHKFHMEHDPPHLTLYIRSWISAFCSIVGISAWLQAHFTIRGQTYPTLCYCWL